MNKPAQTVPIVILGGSDLKPARLPEEGQEPITGYKGVDLRIGGRPLVAELIERLESSGAFDPVFIAGPAEIYGPVRGKARLIDTNGPFGDNIRCSIEAVRKELGPGPMAFITCDVLPEAETLRALMANHDSHSCDIWFPLIRADDVERLGASRWKPAYRVRPVKGEPAARILPGHLIVFDPAGLRLDFIYRLFQVGYATRNRSIAYRRSVMVRNLLGQLLYQDLLHVLGLRLPTLTWTVLTTGTAAATELRAGTVTRRRLEHFVRRMFVTARHRRRHPERRVSMPLVDALPLALDIDTVGEAQAAGAEFHTRAG